MARSKKIQVIDPADEEIDPRLACLAALRDQVPQMEQASDTELPATEAGMPEPAPATASSDGQRTRTRSRRTSAATASATPPAAVPTPATALPDLADLATKVSEVEAQARAAREEAQARKAEADAIRARLEEVARARQEALGLLRRLQAQREWAGAEVSALERQVAARIEAIEAEARETARRLQELEADEGVRRLRAEEEAHRQAEAARQRAEEARQLLREGKVTEALRLLARAEGEEAARARDEALQVARRLVGGALFRARQALEDGDHQGVVQAAQQVAHLLPHMGGPDRQALQGLFCRAAAALAPADLPLVLIRGKKVERQGRRIWTVRPGHLAVGSPCKGGAKVLFNLGTPWRPGQVVPEGQAEILPLRARHAQTASTEAKSSSSSS